MIKSKLFSDTQDYFDGQPIKLASGMRNFIIIAEKKSCYKKQSSKDTGVWSRFKVDWLKLYGPTFKTLTFSYQQLTLKINACNSLGNQGEGMYGYLSAACRPMW